MFETDTAAPFVWGAGGAQVTPGMLSAQRRIAEAMMQQGMDTSPIKSPWQGLDRVAKSLVGTWQAGKADDDQTAATRDAIAGAMAAYRGGQPDLTGAAAVPAVASPGAAPMAPAARPAVVADTEPGKIYSNDEPSPLDPPSGDARDMAIRTIVAEAGNQPFAGQTGVAAVLRNRAVDGGYGGDTLPGVIQKPAAFEPWNTPAGREKMAAIPASDPRYAAAGQALDAAYGAGGRAPDDPTEGATHFVAPVAQAALGRAMPAWAQGDGTKIGDHVFYSPDDAAGGGVKVASADPAALPTAAKATQGGYVIPGQDAPAVSPGVQAVAAAMPATAAAAGPAAPPIRPGVDAIVKAMSNPFLPPALAAGLAQQLKPREVHAQETDAQGNIWDVNRTTGQRQIALKKDPNFSPPNRDADGNLVQRDATGKVTVLSAAEKAPTSVSEYKFYKDNFVPTPERRAPMGYDTWSTAKARAGATNITNTIGGEKKGLEEASKLDAETVRKGQNEILPAIEDADHNFQLMQAAIARNGGKLPTGGELGKLGLDWARTKDYIAQNWGIDLGSDPTKTTSLETFNKGGIKAAGDMAKAIGGSRVLKVEFDMAQRANPGLETSDAGNKYILDVNRQGLAIKRDFYQAQEDYWRGNNHSLDGFQKHWAAEIHNNPRPLSSFSVAPPVPQDDGTQFVKLPSTAKGGYSWYRQGQDGMSPVADAAVSARLEASAAPLKPAAPAPTERVIGGKTYVKQDGNWFEKAAP
jgi:spore germination cell wall hydrolase CwlJ-like protein